MELDDGDDGGDDQDEDESPLERDAVDVAVQRVDEFLVEEIKLAGVHFQRRGVRPGVEHAGDAPSRRDDEEPPDDDEESDEDDDERGLRLKDSPRAERAEHTETSLAGDDHRHEARGEAEAVETQQKIAHHEQLDRTSPLRDAGDHHGNPVDVEQEVQGHQEEVSQRLEEQAKVDPLLQALLDEDHHAQDVARGAREKQIKTNKIKRR